MSYTSESVLQPSVRLRDVVEMVGMLRYRRTGTFRSAKFGTIEEWYFFDDKDYRSWNGVSLSMYVNKARRVVVETRTSVGRSYFDLQHQNDTIATIRRRFGGTFNTDEGRGRYLRPQSPPPLPAASGCHLAFHRLGSHLIKAKSHLESRYFQKFHVEGLNSKVLPRSLREYDPKVLGNNLLTPYLVAGIEEYFKSVFVAVLRYSGRRSRILRNMRLGGEDLVRMSERQSSLEEGVADSLSFQRLEQICSRFEELMPKIDLSGVLRRPYHQRKQTLYDTITELIAMRHEFIHRAALELRLTDERLDTLIYDLAEAIIRTDRAVFKHHGWPLLGRYWYLGRRARRRPPASDKASA